MEFFLIAIYWVAFEKTIFLGFFESLFVFPAKAIRQDDQGLQKDKTKLCLNFFSCKG
jgi:hypothetical protein